MSLGLSVSLTDQATVRFSNKFFYIQGHISFLYIQGHISHYLFLAGLTSASEEKIWLRWRNTSTKIQRKRRLKKAKTTILISLKNRIQNRVKSMSVFLHPLGLHLQNSDFHVCCSLEQRSFHFHPFWADNLQQQLVETNRIQPRGLIVLLGFLSIKSSKRKILESLTINVPQPTILVGGLQFTLWAFAFHC